MARILITSGPTRQYLDPVRYLSNGSSGQMGAALAHAAVNRGNEVVIVSGPVSVVYPDAAETHPVTTTEQMLDRCLHLFPECDGVIAAAAPCDYRPRHQAKEKLKKTGASWHLELVETPDILARLGEMKQGHQWSVGFALETSAAIPRAYQKLMAKNCDWIIVNGVDAIDSPDNCITILDRKQNQSLPFTGTKQELAEKILTYIQRL